MFGAVMAASHATVSDNDSDDDAQGPRTVVAMHDDGKAHDLAVVPACQYDDGTSSDGGDVCYWDAGEAGEVGRNFLAMHIGNAMVFTYEDGTVTRIEGPTRPAPAPVPTCVRVVTDATGEADWYCGEITRVPRGSHVVNN